MTIRIISVGFDDSTQETILWIDRGLKSRKKLEPIPLDEKETIRLLNQLTKSLAHQHGVSTI